MKTRDVMTSPVTVVYERDAIRDAAVLFTETGFAVLPVVASSGQLVGVVSESDILGAGASTASDLAGRLVAEVMTTAVTTVELDADISLAVRELLERRLRCLPVVYEGRPVGVLCRRNILKTLVREDEFIAARVRALLRDYAGPARRWVVSVYSGVVRIGGEFADEAERRVVTALARTEPGVLDVELVVAAPTQRSRFGTEVHAAAPWGVGHARR